MGVSLAPMADLLSRISDDGDVGYLSTHPPTPARTERLRNGNGR
jgi:hypothetical protein